MTGGTDVRSGSGYGPAPDTIVAQATPPGVSAIAVIRLSGPESRAILGRLAGDSELPPRSPRLLALHHPITYEPLDQALVTTFPGPDSYTGEDLVELSCHGGWVTPLRVAEACIAAGAREAEPGEFTRRAVLNGKMDLIQAEAVLDLIEGRSRALRQVAVHQVEKGLSLRIAALRESLVRLEALLAHHIDFPEEDDAPVPVERIVSEARALLDEMDRMLATAPEGELLREGALTVLAGKPNTGKSSLYNALIGRDRAIVTEIPGTTRDALEAVVSMGGFPFRIVDTAGIRESAEAVERIGIEVSHRYLEHAEAVLYCCEAGTGLDENDIDFIDSLEGRRVTLVRTKADLAHGAPTDGDRAFEDSGIRSVTVSTVSGKGLDDLRSRLVADVFGELVSIDADMPVLTRERQTSGLRTARDGVAAFVTAVCEGVGAEMASTHLRPAETALEELLGVITTDDVLDVVFSQFCVGK